MKTFVTTLLALALAASTLPAQKHALSCKDNRSGFCDIRESTIPAGSILTVDGHENGGVRVQGANRSDILVRAKVQADTDADGAQVVVHTSGSKIEAKGPAHRNWSVSYEIFVPANTNLAITARNGGIAVSGVQSAIEFHGVNGGISLRDVGGDIRGETVNGGVSVDLATAQWKGRGIDISTKNGGVSVRLPEHFSALLELATVNGGMSVRMPQAQLHAGERKLSMTLGSGGPLLRIHTLNGAVSVSSPAA